MSSIDTSEKRFESDIETAFLSHGFTKVNPENFSKENMLFQNILVEFLKNSQPKEWARYVKYYGEKAGEKIVRRVYNAVDSRGILDVMKNGITDMGINLKLCFFKPESDLDENSVDLYNKNIVGITRQFPYSRVNSNTIDMVLSVNGIPLFAFELKNQFKNQDYQCSIKQWKEDRDPKEEIFHFNTRFLAYFAVDLYEVWMTTQLKGEKTYFMPFNQGSEGAGKAGGKGNPANPNGYPTSYLWEEVFQKDSLLDLIQRFITIVEEKKEIITNGVSRTTTEKKLIFPRFHQYDVVHKVIDDVKANGAGRNYLIEHSAGSGKSNSIAWIAYRLACAFKDEKPIFNSTIIVTNRIVLDTQLQETLASFEHKAGLIECITSKEGSRGLTDAINDKKRIIICTIQKFLYAYKDFDNLDNRNFAIIIDEAHQGQSGESARTLRKALIDKGYEIKKFAEEEGVLPEDINVEDEMLQEVIAQGHHENQSFFAFTATPTPKTLELFGTGEPGHKVPFHIYSMRQAIEEGFILDVLKNYITIKEAFKLVKDSEDNPELLEGKTKRALFRYYKGHDFTINEKVDMIMDNFLHNGRKKINGLGKAMVICDSRHNAVRYYWAIKEYIKNHPDTCIGCNALVAFSGEVKFDNDKNVYREAEMNKDSSGHFINSDKKFRKAFKSPEFNIMVVANKYQTGYDEPLLHSMYVDKKLKGVNAVQTLSRLNRTCRGKEDTLVLDFANTAEEIKTSFKPFYLGIELNGETDVNRVYDLRSKLNDFSLFTHEEIDQFNDLMEKSGDRKKQDATTIGKLASLLKPVTDRYAELDDQNRGLARDTMLKFERTYGFVTQIVRINDKDLFKDYLFVSYLIRLLPKTKVEIFDLTNKVTLQYAQLKETFRGSISLEKEGTTVTPGTPAKPSFSKKKTDTLERIVDKVNDQFEGEFGEGDKVAIDSVFKMMMDDPAIKKKLLEYAKTNDVNMFIKSIFPGEFQRVLVECYSKNDDAFQRLLGNEKFQQTVMDIMAKEIYKSFISSDKKEEK